MFESAELCILLINVIIAMTVFEQKPISISCCISVDLQAVTHMYLHHHTSHTNV